VTPKEKADLIAQLRLINSVARSLPDHEAFCNSMDETLLELEDVASEEIQ
jgi:hypothetical protein